MRVTTLQNDIHNTKSKVEKLVHTVIFEEKSSKKHMKSRSQRRGTITNYENVSS